MSPQNKLYIRILYKPTGNTNILGTTYAIISKVPLSHKDGMAEKIFNLVLYVISISVGMNELSHVKSIALSLSKKWSKSEKNEKYTSKHVDWSTRHQYENSVQLYTCILN